MHTLFRVLLILTVAHVAMARSTALGLEGDTLKPTAPKAGAQETSVNIVNERALAGPNSAAQQRGGRLLLPIETIAEALGDTVTSDSTQRLVTIHRQNGTTAVFNAALNEVRENGAVILTVNG